MTYPNTALALGSLSVHRAMEADTISAYAVLHGDVNQFQDPGYVLSAARSDGMAGRADEEIIMGEINAAITFFDPIAACEIGNPGKAPDVADRFNDQVNFDIRVPGIAESACRYLHRLHPSLRDRIIRGLLVVEKINAAPGFSRFDVLSGGLAQVAMLTAASEHGLLFIHSDQDLCESVDEIHRAMAEQYRFRQDHPRWQVTTFPDIGPMSGTLAGVIPGSMHWNAGDDWVPVGCRHEVSSSSSDPDFEGPVLTDAADPQKPVIL